MIMKRNPIAITPLPLAGRQLDPNWKKSTNDLAETLIAVILENMWKNPQWSVKIEWRQCRKHHAQQSIVISNSIGNLTMEPYD
jgi:hypothetical protein